MRAMHVCECCVQLMPSQTDTNHTRYKICLSVFCFSLLFYVCWADFTINNNHNKRVKSWKKAIRKIMTGVGIWSERIHKKCCIELDKVAGSRSGKHSIFAYFFRLFPRIIYTLVTVLFIFAAFFAYTSPVSFRCHCLVYNKQAVAIATNTLSLPLFSTVFMHVMVCVRFYNCQ